MLAIYPAFEGPFPAAWAFTGCGLFKAYQTLDDLAQQLGVRPLSTFFDSAAMTLAYFSEEDIAGIPVPPVQWHSPEEGLTTIRAVLKHCDSTDTDGQIAGALPDLRELERLLIEAERQGNRFHLLMDI